MGEKTQRRVRPSSVQKRGKGKRMAAAEKERDAPAQPGVGIQRTNGRSVLTGRNQEEIAKGLSSQELSPRRKAIQFSEGALEKLRWPEKTSRPMLAEIRSRRTTQ